LQASLARTGMEQALTDMRRSVGMAIDPRFWSRRHPFACTAVVFGAMLTGGFALRRATRRYAGRAGICSQDTCDRSIVSGSAAARGGGFLLAKGWMRCLFAAGWGFVRSAGRAFANVAVARMLWGRQEKYRAHADVDPPVNGAGV
jgi:hypothetical protein